MPWVGFLGTHDSSHGPSRGPAAARKVFWSPHLEHCPGPGGVIIMRLDHHPKLSRLKGGETQSSTQGGMHERPSLLFVLKSAATGQATGKRPGSGPLLGTKRSCECSSFISAFPRRRRISDLHPSEFRLLLNPECAETAKSGELPHIIGWELGSFHEMSERPSKP